AADTTEQFYHQEAELTYQKSHREIIVSYDRTTPSISPNHPTQMRYNILGGAGFAAEGQWVSWKINVEQSGYYNLDFAYRQNISSGMESRRRIMIDGEVPFGEMDCIKFAPANDFTLLTLSDAENNPYRIYLSKGEHEIKMEVVLSEMKPLISEMKQIIGELNRLYSKIMIIVGETPDLFRDYDLQVSVENLNEVLDSCNERLQKLAVGLKTDEDENSSNTARILETARMLDELSKNPQDIPKRLDNFRSKINMLSDLIGEMRSQPLELDYLTVRSPGVSAGSGKKSFMDVVKFRFLSFFGSFVNDYSVVDINNDYTKEPLKVWVSTSDLTSGTYGVGRDQAQIINQLSIDMFSQKTEIPVNISLINSNNTLLPAIVSGKGPDCAVFVPRTVYTNLYFRKALVDLKQMPDFQEIKSRFYESAFISLEDGEKTFGLPEVQTYNMMYYRTDIFQEYGLTPPKTWQEFYALTAVLQKKGMQAGIGESPQIFEMFLLQNGGSLYREDMSSTNLMQQSSVDAFTAWTDIYVKYGLPKAFDPLSRFRTGQIPLLLASSSFYGQLCVGAPEISNLWAMLPIPGTTDENGNINRRESCNITAAVVINSSDRHEDSYAFIDWWTTAETQTRFGFESEAQIGVSARYFPANKQVVEKLGWTGDEQKSLLAQWGEVGDVPQSLATYFMTRNLTNAFRRVVYDNETPRDVIYRYGRMVDEELLRKRKEFGLVS
ncbi:MAG: extracellular solute-binding protein, partial [Oscillospiraceae bacterium]